MLNLRKRTTDTTGRPARALSPRRRAAVVLASTVALVGLSTSPSFAASVHPMTTYRGVAGCFAWSWSDSGWFSTTVYWHNRCSTPHKLEVQWDGNAYALTKRTVAANGSGNTWTTSDGVKAVYDAGRA